MYEYYVNYSNKTILNPRFYRYLKGSILLSPAKLYIWEMMVQELYTSNSPFNQVKQGAGTQVGLIADDMNTYKALLAISPALNDSAVPLAVQLKLGLFTYNPADSDATNASILSALLKIREQNVYLIAQVNYSTSTIFPVIRDELFQLGECPRSVSYTIELTCYS